jgi:hypothetical protein
VNHELNLGRRRRRAQLGARRDLFGRSVEAEEVLAMRWSHRPWPRRSRRPSVGGRGGGSRNAGGDITPAETEARRLMFIEKLDSLSAALQFREAPPLDLSQGCAEPQALRGYAVLPGLVHRDLSVPEALLRFQFRERIGRQ